MTKLDFVKYSPGGNPTILVTGPKLSAQARAAVAAELMHPQHLVAEQVGFIDLAASPPRLDMMGGEFCLNATRCLVYEMWHAGLFLPLAGADDYFGLVQSSGLEQPAQVRVKNARNTPADKPAECFVQLEVKREIVEVDKGALLVRLPGICHLLLDERYHDLPEYPMVATRERLGRYGLLDEAACGVIWHRMEPIAEKNLTACRITPIIHVAATKSCVAETSCGSGTLALALALVPKMSFEGDGQALMRVVQPSGEAIKLRVVPLAPGAPGASDARQTGGELYQVGLGGLVRMIARGETFVAAIAKEG